MDNDSKTKYKVNNIKYSKRIQQLSNNILPLVLCDIVISYLNKYHLTFLSNKHNNRIGAYSWCGKYTKGVYYWEINDIFYKYNTSLVIEFYLTKSGGKIIQYDYFDIIKKYARGSKFKLATKNIKQDFKGILDLGDVKNYSINSKDGDDKDGDTKNYSRNNKDSDGKDDNSKDDNSKDDSNKTIFHSISMDKFIKYFKTPTLYKFEVISSIWAKYTKESIYEFKNPISLSDTKNIIIGKCIIHLKHMCRELGYKHGIIYRDYRECIQQELYELYVADFVSSLIDRNKYPRAKVFITTNDIVLVIRDIDKIVHELEDVYQYAMRRLSENDDNKDQEN